MVLRPGTIIRSTVLSTTSLSWVDSFLLADDTVSHILEQHPEFRRLPSLFDAVERALQSPTEVFQSVTRPDDSLVFIDAGTTNSSGQPLRVPVGYESSSNVGWVRTSYFQGSGSQGLLVWSNQDGAA